jgi:hypothetical protein
MTIARAVWILVGCAAGGWDQRNWRARPIFIGRTKQALDRNVDSRRRLNTLCQATHMFLQIGFVSINNLPLGPHSAFFLGRARKGKSDGGDEAAGSLTQAHGLKDLKLCLRRSKRLASGSDLFSCRPVFAHVLSANHCHAFQ